MSSCFRSAGLLDLLSDSLWSLASVGYLFLVGQSVDWSVDRSVDWLADWCIVAFGEVVIVGCCVLQCYLAVQCQLIVGWLIGLWFCWYFVCDAAQ